MVVVLTRPQCISGSSSAHPGLGKNTHNSGGAVSAEDKWWDGVRRRQAPRGGSELPLSYLESLPPECFPSLCERIGHHQYAMLLSVLALPG